MNTTKMVLVPADSQIGGNETPDTIPPDKIPPENLVIEKPKRIERNPEKIQRLLKIALRIASLDAYDEDFKIKDTHGNPIQDSDITALLNNAISSQKLLIGENDFIRLMYIAKVDPNWLVNENLRSKLLNYRPQSKPKPPISQSPSKSLISPSPPKPTKFPSPEPSKRKFDDEPIKNKKQKTLPPWEIPLPDDDDEL